jgi:NADH dehydrogenase [ubiquinone] 1 alpha subcomplex assembly factor 5
MNRATPFDRRAVRLHRNRAAKRVARIRPLLDDLAGRLLDRLDDTTRRFTHALDIGGRGSVAPQLRARGMEVISCDLSPAMARLSGGLGVAVDEEFLPFAPSSFDLVVACLSLHWVNDLPGTLIQIRRCLRPDGLFLASLPARGTLAELRAALIEADLARTGGASPRIAPFADLRDLAGLLQRAGFALPVADLDALTLVYPSGAALVRDLRDAGETNALAMRDRRGSMDFARMVPADEISVSLKQAVLTGWAP